MNGPSPVMYSLKSLINFSENVELPTNMYKVKTFYSDCSTLVRPDVIKQTGNKISDSEVQDLDTRQSRILQQLKELMSQMEQLKKQLSQSSVPISSKSKECTSSNTNALQNNTTVVDFSQDGIIHDIVINADPKFPPYSLLGVQKLWGGLFNFKISNYVHSSISGVSKEILDKFSWQENNISTNLPTLKVTLIWKNVGPDCEFIISPLTHSPIMGEVNVLRYFHRHVNGNADILEEVLLDCFLDSCYCLIHASSQTEKTAILRRLNAELLKSDWFGGNVISVRDLAAWSAIQNVNNLQLTQKMTKWMEHCSQNISIRSA